MERQYTGANVVVGVAGPVDPEAVVGATWRRRSAACARGATNRVAAPAWRGGVAHAAPVGLQPDARGAGLPDSRRWPRRRPPPCVAAALFGEGMSSPLMDQIRERRGLVYYAACSADVMDVAGQFVIEASTAPEHVDEFLVEVTRLLPQHADTIDAVGAGAGAQPDRGAPAADWERTVPPARGGGAGPVRARQGAAARGGRGAYRGGRPGGGAAAFERMLAERPAVAIAGKLRKGLPEKARALFDER